MGELSAKWMQCLAVVLVMVAQLSWAHPPRMESVKQDDTRNQIDIGPCSWIVERSCPDPDIKFYLFTRQNTKDRQLVHIDQTWELSNLSTSYFDSKHPVKIIIHGYNSDMFLTPLISMKDEYLERDSYNLFYVDWSLLAPAPCYPSSVQNTRHAGKCIAQLIDRIRDGGTSNIHLIGFSLGAHVTNFAANNLKDFKLPRITGLDPAMPLFITASNENKLDASDAEFVDVLHSNALVQGKIERCGHVDFYLNGGVIQPGCFQADTNPIACSHHRAPDYFAESIQSTRGFWGWPCSSYISYLLGFCPRTNYLKIAGEDCRSSTEGMFLITTNSAPPFATGRWTDGPGFKTNFNQIKKRDPFQQQIDEWGKLDGEFNNADFDRDGMVDAGSGDLSYLNNVEHIFANWNNMKNRHPLDDFATRRQNTKQNSAERDQAHSMISNEDFEFPKISG